MDNGELPAASIAPEDRDRNSTPHLITLIKDLKTAFEISDLGEASFLLGLHITYTPDGITLNQELYIGTIRS